MSKYFFSSGARAGQIFIELLVSLSILTVGFMGLFALLSQSIALNRVVRDNYVASYLASEGVEIIKNLIDTNVIQGALAWNDSLAAGIYEVQYDTENPNIPIVGGPAPLAIPQPAGYDDPSWSVLCIDAVSGIYAYAPCAAQTQFKRYVAIAEVDRTGDGVEELVVESLVAWRTRGGVSEVRLEDHFFDWR